MTSFITLPLAGFSSPSYFDNQGASSANGWRINNGDACVVYFGGTGVRTVVWEQTLDPSGAADWFPVTGRSIATGLKVTSSFANLGEAVVFPALGYRMRCRVTALTGADATLRYDVLDSFGDMPETAANLPSSSAGLAPTTLATVALAGSLSVKNSAGNLFGLNVKSPSGAAALQIMLIDSATLPAEGPVTPKKVYDLAAGGTFEDEFNPPIRFSAGIQVVLSTTGPFTKTIALTTNLSFISADFL